MGSEVYDEYTDQNPKGHKLPLRRCAGAGGGYSGTATCTTDGNGQCSLVTDTISGRENSVTFVVGDLTYSLLVYQPADNGDPDGDSDGTVITLCWPW